MDSKKNNKVNTTVPEENTAKQAEPQETMIPMSEVQKMIATEVARAKEELQRLQPAVVNVTKDEYVTLLFVGVIAPGTIVSMGELGRFTKAGAMLDVPKKTFMNGQTLVVQKLLEKRYVLVVDGLTDDERVRYGLDYKKGEVFTKEAFDRLLDFPAEKLSEIFEKLCDRHKEIACSILLSKYFEKSDKRVSLDKVKALNKMTKHLQSDGLLAPVLEDMGAKIGD